MKNTVIEYDIIIKRAGEAKKVVFDFAEVLAASETISTATIAATGLTTSNSISGTKVTVLVSSGTAGTNYLLRCAIATSQSQILYLYAVIQIVEN